MGLDATAYLRGHGVDDDDCADHEAIQCRLGDISRVAYIRERLSRRLPSDSILLEHVLYSGNHTGDELSVELVPAMTEEVALLAGDPDSDMRDFARSMLELAAVALEQGNPICF